jgi:hypothetical protein
MKIYFAGGIVMMKSGREKSRLIQKFTPWRRVISFYFLDCIIKSEILEIKRKNNESKYRTTTTCPNDC